MAAGDRITLKVVLVGNSGVGKSSLVLRYCRGVFNDSTEATIGAAFLSRKIESSGQLYRLEMWDTAGQERYRSLAPMYYRHANAALVCFSIISLATFQGATSWIEELKMRTNPDIILVLVGCKSDLEDRREVFPTHIGELVESFGAVYVECSAKTDTKIDDIFFEIVQQASKRKHLIPKLKDTEIIPTSTIVESTASSKGCAC